MGTRCVPIETVISGVVGSPPVGDVGHHPVREQLHHRASLLHARARDTVVHVEGATGFRIGPGGAAKKPGGKIAGHGGTSGDQAPGD